MRESIGQIRSTKARKMETVNLVENYCLQVNRKRSTKSPVTWYQRLNDH